MVWPNNRQAQSGKTWLGPVIDKQPNIRHAFGGPLYRWSFASAAGFPDQEARWLQDTTSSCGVKY